jgi:hypothetical protein
MSITLNPKLYVTLQPLEHVKPHPINDGRFDPSFAYKVLGVYNASETSECFFILSNTYNEMWFISQRHLRVYKLIDSDEFYIALEAEIKDTVLRKLINSESLPQRNGTH